MILALRQISGRASIPYKHLYLRILSFSHVAAGHSTL